MVRNSAFVFIKPHAITDKVKECVKEVFEKNEIAIKKEGSLEAEDIDKYKKIDKHYYAIASKATILTPDKLNIPKEKFKEKFGLEWDEALKDGKALNAMDACAKFEIDAAALDSMWAACKKAGNLVKFGGGFYCGKLEPEGKGGPFYVFNGFFMSMRSKFVEPGASIYYYVVEWESDKLAWADFRGKILGPTDPADAPSDSLRGAIKANWKEYGLKSEPNTGDNGVHASASPFEGLAERMNWLGLRAQRDPFGKKLLQAGVSVNLINEWAQDPQVTFGLQPITKSIYDTLEDTDSDYCLALCQMIASFAGEPPKKKGGPLENELEKLQAELAKYQEIAKAVAAIQTFVPPAKLLQVEAKAEAKAKAKAKAKPKAKAEKPEKEPTPEKKELNTKRSEITDMKKTLKKDGKSKEEIDEALAPLLEQLKELKEKAKEAAPKADDAAPPAETA
jgi:nucleoside diphosphate kinase